MTKSVAEKKIHTSNNTCTKDLNESLYFFPGWERIVRIPVRERKFIFKKSVAFLYLYRKISSRNMIEKYELRSENGKVLAGIDLKVYKDSVYIIDTHPSDFDKYEKYIPFLLRTAAEKALYNTTEKKVFINFSFSFMFKNRFKKLLSENGFIPVKDQTDYEKNLFGEQFVSDISKSGKILSEIRKFPFLINK